MLPMHQIQETSVNGCDNQMMYGRATVGKQNTTRRLSIVLMISENYLQLCQIQLVNTNQYKFQGVFYYIGKASAIHTQTSKPIFIHYQG